MSPDVGEGGLARRLVIDAEQIFKPTLDEGISFHVEEQISRVRLWQPCQAAPRLRLAHAERGCAALPARVLERGLHFQTVECTGCQFWHACLAFRQLLHGDNAGRLKLAALRATNPGDEAQVVGAFPFLFALVAPPAQSARSDRFGSGGLRGGHKRLQTTTQASSVRGIVGQPKRGALIVSKLDMDPLRRDTLDLGQQVGVKAKLQQVLRIGRSLQLGIDHLVGKRPKLGRALHTLEKVRITTPFPALEGGLINMGWPAQQCLPGLLGSFRQAQVFSGDNGDRRGALLDALQVGRFMGVALLLHQLGGRRIIDGLKVFPQ